MCPTELAHPQAEAPPSGWPTCGMGREEVSVGDVSICNKWLNQQLSPGEMPAGEDGTSRQAQGRGVRILPEGSPTPALYELHSPVPPSTPHPLPRCGRKLKLESCFISGCEPRWFRRGA